MEAKPPRRTRERILELSLKLFNDIGEPNVTTTTIAEEMEISPGNLYYHFRNKDDIINSIFSQFEQQIEKRLRFPDDHRVTIDEMWSYLQYMADFLWTYRFLYRDLNDLLARTGRSKRISSRSSRTRSASRASCARSLSRMRKWSRRPRRSRSSRPTWA